MKNLSYTQEYYLCSFNEKGKVPMFKSPELLACLVVGGIMELKENGYIRSDEKGRYFVAMAWDDKLPYVKPIFEAIQAAKKPPTLKSLAETYLLNDKSMNILSKAIGFSLAEADCATPILSQGLIKSKTRYAPKPECTKHVIEKIRAEVLEEGNISEETVCLCALLDKSGIIKNYFSKIEANELKKRLKQIRVSEAYQAVKEMMDVVEIFLAIIATSGTSV